ncbi:MAG: DUF4331 domain-containing protein [Phycisphaerales bacterium]|nr:DUF4331 domain-containing protein [Phycisphaerales bacterium]
MNTRFLGFGQIARTACGLSLLAGAAGALASSHSDAPLSKQDPNTNLTDVYAFIGTKYDEPDTNVLNIVVNVHPFGEPGDGVIYDRFADDVLYSIHIADPASGAILQTYDFRFSSINEGYKNLNTILSYGLGTEAGPIEHVGDARQNFTQTYSLTRTIGGSPVLLGDDLLTPPPNVGGNTTPHYNDAFGFAISGAQNFDELDRYTQETAYSLPSGVSVWAGPRDDSFFADTPGIFDLLHIRILDNNHDLSDGLGQDGKGFDGFKGFNVLTMCLQIPVADLPALPYTSAFFGAQTGVGVFATCSRQQTRTLNPNGVWTNSGPWIQVNRLGNPLFNEVLVALADKNRYNVQLPTSDATSFVQYARTPELPGLINFVYGTSFATTMREDLVNVFIPDVIRVNTTTGPVPLAGQPGFSRFGFIGGDTTNGVSSGWPNGRRLGDDVVDIALTAVASGPAYTSITVVGDNIEKNDVAYHQVFPYAATPNSGLRNRKDSLSGDFNGDWMINNFDIDPFVNCLVNRECP